MDYYDFKQVCPVQNILLVDDEPSVLSATKNFLEKCYQNVFIECAHNGHEAIDIAYTKNIDLIILDFHMPGMNGLQVLNFVKQHERTRAAKVITISSYHNKLQEMLFYGSDTALEKPFSPPLLTSAVGQLLPQIRLKKGTIIKESPKSKTNIPHDTRKEVLK